MVTCVDAAVSLQLAWFGKRLLTSVTFEHPRLLRAQGRTGLMCLHVLLVKTNAHVKNTEDHDRTVQTGNRRGKTSAGRPVSGRRTTGSPPVRTLVGVPGAESEVVPSGWEAGPAACQGDPGSPRAPGLRLGGAVSRPPSLSATMTAVRGPGGYSAGCPSTERCLTFSSSPDQGCGLWATGSTVPFPSHTTITAGADSDHAASICQVPPGKGGHFYPLPSRALAAARP